ncbi:MULTISPECIES: IclR family transcriptional regulator [unclassified Paraburkholderia]|uniref:IclR family transcriptional regulator n=1 Tax=unclassified Paraburkholderia TaxID=2615204 RepID=UPI002AB7BF94|nr:MULTISPECIES: helix-turn-helix domain-containing protein [unclassified Paraburkholderia]
MKSENETDGDAFSRMTPGSQTLARGLGLLRVFLGGAPMLSNAQIAERTGVPKATVSRLTHSLVNEGYLEYDPASRGYRLAPVCLSLGRSFEVGRTELATVLPLLREVAVSQRVNVSLSAADGLSMVYLATIREGRGPLRRTAAPGTRFAMETSSIGHAWLAALQAPRRKTVLAALADECGAEWPRYSAAIDESIALYASRGYCRSGAMLGAEGIATAVAGPYGVIYTPGISFSAADNDYTTLIAHFVPVLLGLADAMRAAWADFAAA